MAAITGVAVAYSVISFRSRSSQLNHISFQKRTSKKDYGLKSASLSVKFGISSLCFGLQLPPPTTVALRVFCSSNIEERAKKIIAKQSGVEESEILNRANFVEDLGADSFDLAELRMALEEEFDIEMPEKEAENITTVQAAVDFITRNQQ